MELQGAAQQVWIFIGESDLWHGRSLYLSILETLKRNGCAGGTVFRGIAGFGAHNLIHTTSLVELSSDLPIVVTFVDRADRVARVLPEITAMVNEGLITVIPVDVLKYSHRSVGPFPSHLTVADVMTRSVARVQTTTPIAEIVLLLIDRALRALPVVTEDGQVVGIVTDGDLLRRGATELPVDLQRELPLAERAAHVAQLESHPQCAADVMTPHPITLPATTGLAQAAAVMVEHNVKRLPVVDSHGALIGMVSRYDLLKTVAEGLRQRPDMPIELPLGTATTASDIMMREVPRVRADTPLAEALDCLLETEKRRVIVIDADSQVVGIITDGDVMRRAAKRVRGGALRRLAGWFSGGPRPHEVEVESRNRTASDVMTSPVVTVQTDTPIVEVIHLMTMHRIKRVPVVDSNGRLVGLVGRAGVLSALSQKRP
jgi:CBS-domain-containing membrane protein/PII-like signaling protein